MKGLFSALLIIGLVFYLLWHFDPSAIKRNLEKKTHRQLPGKVPLIYRCSLQKTFYLLGPQRRSHALLRPEEVTLKHILARTLNDTEAFKETIPPEKAQGYTERKLKRKEQRRLEKLIAKNCIYTAKLDSLGGNSATVHVIGQTGKKKQLEQWCILWWRTNGWVVEDLSNEDW